MKNVEEINRKLQNQINLIFPHQLFEKSPLNLKAYPCILIEEHLFFRQFAFHKQKIAFHRSSMKFYKNYLTKQKITVEYIESHQDISDIRKLVEELKNRGIEKIHYIDPVDDWIERRLTSCADKKGILLQEHESPMFINTKERLEGFFKSDRRKFFQTKWYTQERKRLNILIDKEQKPIGGKWTFDTENRKKYPKKKQAPIVFYPDENAFFIEAKEYVQKHFGSNPGILAASLYPTNYKESQKWLSDFFEQRFSEFGPYEDAIVKDEHILNHSVLTPMLNVGLLLPDQIVRQALAFAERQSIPLNSLEGFVRQIIGWREFIRGVYVAKGREERTKNFWCFTRKIPASFYDGTTGIYPIDQTIKKILKTGYCHHIERLMVLGNFMILCEFDPDEVYRWFMELFIDAYDWVMVPNVYGMSQFADGGIMSTKPYISGSNYLKKMSDYPNGEWQIIWNALFWRFISTKRAFFLKNPRLSMMVRLFDKMEQTKATAYLTTADNYLKSLKS